MGIDGQGEHWCRTLLTQGLLTEANIRKAERAASFPIEYLPEEVLLAKSDLRAGYKQLQSNGWSLYALNWSVLYRELCDRLRRPSGTNETRKVYDEIKEAIEAKTKKEADRAHDGGTGLRETHDRERRPNERMG